MITEKDIQSYYREKIQIVAIHSKKWKEVSLGTSAKAMKSLSEAEGMVEKLEAVDSLYFEKFGEKAFLEALHAVPSESEPSVIQDRDDLRDALLSVQESMGTVKSRLQEMKDGLGRRLSDLKPRRKLPRHGRFDSRA